MGITVEQFAREVVGSLNLQTGHLIAAAWVNRRYAMVCDRLNLKHLRRVGELVVPAIYSTGTATVTRDATSVTGSGTTWTSQTGRFFRGRSGWYEIGANGGATAITLVSGFGEDSGSGLAYRIATRKIAVAANARKLEFVYNRATGEQLDCVSLEQLDYASPQREESGPPRKLALIGSEPDGSGVETLRVEAYPYPTQNTILSYSYYLRPPTLALTDEVPDPIPPAVISEGILIDAFRYMMALSLQEGKPEAAGVWRNEARSQETSWERRIEEAGMADRGWDRSTILVEGWESSGSRLGSI